MPIIESVVNIIASIILVKYFGLAGVFMGTIISGLMLWCYSYPKYVYKNLFNRSYKNYFKETFGYILLFIGIAVSTYLISNIYIIDSNLLRFIIKSMVGLIIPNIILFIIFRKTDNFKYYLKIFKKESKVIDNGN